MSVAGWKRVRFDPATALVWRSDGSLVIGFNDLETSHALHICEHPKLIATWLTLFDGSRSGHELLRSALAMGVPLTQATAVMGALAEAGHMYEVTSVAPAGSASTAHRELRVGARMYGLPLEEFTSRTVDHRILVLGSGSLAAAIFTDLRQTFAHVGWQPDSTARIRPEDAVGSLASAEIGRPWFQLEQPQSQPTLVIAVGDVLDVSSLVDSFPDCALLPVVAHQHRFAIGPLLETSVSLCARCIHHNRMAADGEWSFAITQLTHHKRALPIHSVRHINNVASTVTLHVDFLLRNNATFGLLSESFELIPPNPLWRRRSWQQVEGCNCLSGLNESQSVE
ncbi:MAG: hypothetical protein RIS75_131 [Actinomycetota bacterium]